MDKVKLPAWRESVEGIMDRTGFSREDAQFMFDYEHGLLEWDERHLPTIMRIYSYDKNLAELSMALNTGVLDPPRDRPATRPAHPPRRRG